MTHDLFFQIHSGLPREGPGDFESTRRALEMIPGLPPSPRILDVGCGPGMQTLDLASLTDGTIVAVDSHQPYLDRLATRARRDGVQGRIEIVHADMAALDLERESFDLVWGEGSLYSIGFQHALVTLRPLLRPRGSLAATELTWLVPDPPDEAREFFARAYPDMTDIPCNLERIAAAGYEPVGEFTLPEESWWQDYYLPMERRIAELLEQQGANRRARALLDEEQAEIDLFRRHSHAYGYVFYVMREADAR